MTSVNDNPDRSELGFGKVVEDAVGLNCKKCGGGLVRLSTYAEYWTGEDCKHHIIEGVTLSAWYCELCTSLSSFNVTESKYDC